MRVCVCVSVLLVFVHVGECDHCMQVVAKAVTLRSEVVLRYKVNDVTVRMRDCGLGP